MLKQKACKKQVLERYKSIDQFGQTVSFTYNGEDQYKTHVGATTSLIIALILLAYGIFKATELFSKSNPSVTKTTLIQSIWEGEDFSPLDLGFDFAFSLNQDLDPTVGYFTIRAFEQILTDNKTSDGKPIRMKNYTDLTFSKCGDSGFNFDSQEVVKAFSIDNYYCLNSDANYVFKGNFYSQDFKYLELKLWKCSNSTTSSVKCKNQTYIDNYFANEEFKFAFVNTYFDINDFGQEIKQFIDDSLFFELDSNTSKKANMYIQQNEAELEDDYIQLGQSRDVEFYQVQNIRTYDDSYSTSGTLVTIYMRLDKFYDSYQRKIYSILDLLGDVGGLGSSLIVIGGILIGFVIERLFLGHAIKKIYQIRKQNDCDDIFEKSPKNSANKVTDLNSAKRQAGHLDGSLNDSIARQNLKNINQNSMDLNHNKWDLVQHQPVDDHNNQLSNRALSDTDKEKTSIVEREEMLAKQFKFKNILRQKDLSYLISAMTNRGRFLYSYKNILGYALRCLCLRNLDNIKHKKVVKKHFLFQKAQDKLMMELDFVRIVKTLRKFKMLAQALLTQKDRLVLKFQRQSLIETNSSSSDSDDGDFDPSKMMENKNPFTRLAIFGRMKKMMEDYKDESIDKYQRQMMRGIFIKNLKDFTEKQKDKSNKETLLLRLKENMKIDEDNDTVERRTNDKDSEKYYHQNKLDYSPEDNQMRVPQLPSLTDQKIRLSSLIREIEEQ